MTSVGCCSRRMLLVRRSRTGTAGRYAWSPLIAAASGGSSGCSGSSCRPSRRGCSPRSRSSSAQVQCLGVLAGHQGRRRPGQRRSDHRHLDPGRRPGAAGRGLLGSGQPVRGLDDHFAPAARLGRAVQPCSHREQHPVLLRHGDERGPRLVVEEPRQGVPEVDVLGDGSGAGDLHPSGAGDQLDRARRGAVAHRRCDAGLRCGVRELRLAVVDADRRIMLVTASLGGMLTWLAGPFKGLLLISRQEGYLPPFLQKLNKNGVQQNILVTQGVITTFIALGYALIPSVSSAYWIFSVIPTQVYLIMYLLMFLAAVMLRRKHPDHPRGYRAPMLLSMCGVGFAASLAALLVGFIPPSQFASGNSGVYFVIVGGGALGLGLLVPFLFYRLRKPSWRQPETLEVSPS